MAQRNKLYQTLDTQTIFGININSLLVLAFSWDSLTMRKIKNIILLCCCHTQLVKVYAF